MHTGEELFFVYNSAALEDILADTTLTSADFLAVIGGVFEQADIEQSALRYARLFANEK